MSEEVVAVERPVQNESSSLPEATSVIDAQRAYYESGATRPPEFRVKQLKQLKKALLAHSDNLLRAMYEDLRKCEAEAYATEIGITIADIEYAIRNVRTWMEPTRVHTPLAFMPGKSRIIPEPYGVSLIISPWNYPIKNLFGPALGAIAAGNCLVLKPSEISPSTSAATKKMIDEFFEPQYIKVIEGGIPETTVLLDQTWDYIFFTGAPSVGRIVYQAAAHNLTPCTLELGGKSPTIVDKNINFSEFFLYYICHLLYFIKI